MDSRGRAFGEPFLPSHLWLSFFCRAISWLGEKNGFSSDFRRLLRFLRNRRGPGACRRKSQAIFDGRRGSFFLKEKRRIFSSSFGRGKSIEIGGNNGSFRAPISDRCPEGTSKTRGKEKRFRKKISPIGPPKENLENYNQVGVLKILCETTGQIFIGGKHRYS